MAKSSFLNRIKTRWGITSNFQVFLIFCVFGLTGSISVKVAQPILDYMGIHSSSMNPFLYWPLRILLIFPVYQVLLLMFGTLLGQFSFFWNFEKKMFGRMFGKREETE